MDRRFFCISIFLSLFFVPGVSHAAVTPDDPGNFITTWNTENPGTSNNNQITIPGTGGGYSYEIYWENTASSTQNGTTSLITTDSYTLTFPEPGIYEVQASGTFPRIYFNDSGDKDKILTVEQWGDIAWSSMDRAFMGCSNLRVPATDAPDLSGVTSLALMFFDAFQFNDPIGHWDTSNIANMEQMFVNTMSFNQSINAWDTSNLTNMQQMFDGASAFNQPLNAWDVSKVTSFFRVFDAATSFNQPLNDWDVSSSTNMAQMFIDATSFNQPINSWDVSNVDNMNFMFRDATSFNQPLNNWNISNVTTFFRMFSGATAFNQPLSNWDTSSVDTATNVFNGATSFDQDLSNWEVGLITSLNGFFNDVSLSQQNLDATLQSWSQQSVQNNVPLDIGLKTYSTIGAQAIATLEDTYNWDITEQYQAEYSPSSDATLFGSSIQGPLDAGATTTAVEIDPDSSCEFIQWSDGNTDNPRQDVLTDNLSVTAELSCRSSSGGTSASGRAAALERQGKDEEAAAIRDRYNTGDNTTSDHEAPESLEESLDAVQQLPEAIDIIIASDPSPETVRSLIAILVSLVEALSLLMAQGN